MTPRVVTTPMGSPARTTGIVAAAVAFAATLVTGCSLVLGLGDVPTPVDGGAGSDDASDGTTGVASADAGDAAPSGDAMQ